MIIDLNGCEAQGKPVSCDVAIVGAGIAGSLIANELSRRGLAVIVLESGAATQDADTHPLNRVVQTGLEYGGAEHGRYRCLGGTSTRWGGAMLPFQPADLTAREAVSTPSWPVDHRDLLRYLEPVERLFGLPPGGYDDQAAGRMLLPRFAGNAVDPIFQARAPKWPPFRKRNVARVFRRQFRSAKGPQIWINATVTGMTLNEAGRLALLQARSPRGNSLAVAPAEAVIAAGAIESTRLLLKLDADCDHRLFGIHDVIGRFFHDHLSAPVARIEVRDRNRLDRIAGLRFQGAAMRNTRFELDGSMAGSLGLPGAFMHISFATDAPTGFDGLREIYRTLQRRGLPRRGSLGLIAGNAGWLARAAWHRAVQRRVLPPRGARYEAHLVIEQIPVAGNRIRLSDFERDLFGIALAEIEWHVSAHDIANARRVLDAFARCWSGTTLSRAGDLQPYPAEQWIAALVSCGGIYHPGGTLRMSSSPRCGVVSGELRTFAVPNLTVVSTAAFPSGGSANPTLMLALFAMRAADRLAQTTP